MSFFIIVLVVAVGVIVGLWLQNNHLNKQNKQLQMQNHSLFMANNRLFFIADKATTELRITKLELSK